MNAPSYIGSTSPNNPLPPPPKKGGCLKGCLITFLILLALIAAALFYVYQKAGPFIRQKAAFVIEEGLDSAIKESALPADQKIEIEKTVRSYTARIRNGEIGLMQGAQTLQSLASGPFMFYAVTTVFKGAYLNPTYGTPEQIAEGEIALSRFQYGLLTSKISNEQAATVIALFGEKNNKDDLTPRKDISKEEVQAGFKAMGAAADIAGVPAGMQEVSPLAELKKVLGTGS